MASEPDVNSTMAGSSGTGSGRTPAEVLAALEAGERVDPREARLAEAWAEREGV